MTRIRNPEQTRRRLLEAASHEIHRNGFQSASLDRILKKAGVTKGALYHHFPSKAALGLAVVNEVVAGKIRSNWVMPLGCCDDPITAIRTVLAGSLKDLENDYMALGCALNNLAQEMSPINEDFRDCCGEVFGEWRGGFADVLRNGQVRGLVRPDIDPESAATFLVAAVEGTVGMMKNAQSFEPGRQSLEMLDAFLESLRPQAPKQSLPVVELQGATEGCEAC
jgi:AcrR family transcriptional regulator